MRDNARDKIRLYLLHRIPLITTLVLMLMFYVPVNSQNVNYFRPTIGLIGVYYWSFKRDYIFGFCSAFIVGFLADVYSASPLGINILMMMLLVLATNLISRYFRASSFVVDWCVFAFIGLIFTLVKWFILSVYVREFLPLTEVLLGLLSTIMFYPLIAYINMWIQNNLLPQERINE